MIAAAAIAPGVVRRKPRIAATELHLRTMGVPKTRAVTAVRPSVIAAKVYTKAGQLKCVHLTRSTTYTQQKWA